MTVTTITAEEYKASLPKNGRGVLWTMETFATYVNLLYTHVTVKAGQEWSGVMSKYILLCEEHGEYQSTANSILRLNIGCRCKQCSAEYISSLAGIRRTPRVTPEEKARAAELFKECQNYSEVGRQLGRSQATIQKWLDPIYAEKARQRTAQWREENRERARANSRRYTKEFSHGIAVNRTGNSNRRIRTSNTPEYVFLDNQWYEVDRRETYRVFKDELLPLMERVHIKQLYLEAQKLTEETGVEYHIDHIQPLSKGGEHLMINLQLLPVTENLSKGNAFRPEDQIELCRRLFNPTPEYTPNEHYLFRHFQAA